jgi:regulatory protein
MRITAIKAQIKNPDRVSVFVDKVYSFSLTLSQLVEASIKKDQEVSEQDIKSFKQLSNQGKMLTKALNWVMLRPRSERELRQYMSRKNRLLALEKRLDDEQVGQIISYCLDKKYVDDEAFARWWIDRRTSQRKSTSFVRSELYLKGIGRELIEAVLSEKTDTDSLPLLIAKLRTRRRYDDHNKLIRFLLSKGYGYSDVVAALAEPSE